MVANGVRLVPYAGDRDGAGVSLVTEQHGIVAQAALLLHKRLYYLRADARGKRPVLTALKVDHHHDLRIAPGSNSGEPAVALEVTFQVLFLQAMGFKIVVAHPLRATCFSRKVDALNMRGDARSARIQHVGHGIRDGNPVLRVDRHAHGITLAAFARSFLELRGKLFRVHQMRRIKNTAHSNSTDGASNLNGTNGHGALPDTHRDDLTRIPFLAEGLHLPLFRRHDAADLVGQIHSRFFANAHGACPFCDLFNAQALCERVKENVARLVNSLGHVNRAVSALRIVFHPALVIAAKEYSPALAVHFQVLRYAFLQARN